MGWTLQFDDGTLVVMGATLAELPPEFVWDKRIEAARGPPPAVLRIAGEMCHHRPRVNVVEHVVALQQPTEGPLGVGRPSG